MENLATASTAASAAAPVHTGHALHAVDAVHVDMHMVYDMCNTLPCVLGAKRQLVVEGQVGSSYIALQAAPRIPHLLIGKQSW